MKQIILAIIISFCFVSVTSATILQVGDPFPTGSWSQQWNESGVGNFDKIEAFYLSGPKPGALWEYSIGNLSNGSWTGTLVSPYYTYATGSAVTSLNFNTYWLGSSSDHLSWDFLAWESNTLKEWTTVTRSPGWSFTSHSISDYDMSIHDRSPVPEPGTFILLGAGLFGLGLVARRRKKA